LVDGEKLDIRVWLNSERYSGPTKRWVRFYIHEGIWKEFYKLMGKADREYQEIA